MWWPRPPRQEVGRKIVLRHSLDLTALELQAAKEILAEIFRARPGDVEDMIRQRLQECQEE